MSHDRPCRRTCDACPESAVTYGAVPTGWARIRHVQHGTVMVVCEKCLALIRSWPSLWHVCDPQQQALVWDDLVADFIPYYPSEHEKFGAF